MTDTASLLADKSSDAQWLLKQLHDLDSLRERVKSQEEKITALWTQVANATDALDSFGVSIDTSKEEMLGRRIERMWMELVAPHSNGENSPCYFVRTIRDGKQVLLPRVPSDYHLRTHGVKISDVDDGNGGYCQCYIWGGWLWDRKWGALQHDVINDPIRPLTQDEIRTLAVKRDTRIKQASLACQLVREYAKDHSLTIDYRNYIVRDREVIGIVYYDIADVIRAVWPRPILCAAPWNEEDTPELYTNPEKYMARLHYLSDDIWCVFSA